MPDRAVHVLQRESTYCNAAAYDTKTLMWQTLIHLAFLLSAMALAYVDRLLPQHAPGH